VSDKKKLKVVLCWHMHQPYYRDAVEGEYKLPWTYLHAIKDYEDMVALLEENPAARAVVNFTPTLLEQIDDYAQQTRHFLQDAQPLRDPLLAALVAEELPSNATARIALVRACLRANEKRVIHRFPAYKYLAEIANTILARQPFAAYFSDQFLADLLMWYHLAWLGETVRQQDERVKALMQVLHGYTLQDRKMLLEVLSESMQSVIARYRQLAESGRVELSVTPYGHPIIPLLLDMQSTHQAMPEAPLPEPAHYPGGEERAGWHIREGLRVFESYFGFQPVGCWPSEGAVSEATLALLSNSGFRWAATGESVLRHSLHASGITSPGCIHHPFSHQHSPITCFFRDDGLSDLIGFTYSDWHAEDAVNNLLHHLENIGTACQEDPNRVVSIIMDGENAWEYYPENGYHFLSALYKGLVDHPELELTTFGSCLEQGVEAAPLTRLIAGSWVYGSFSTWIGEKHKNRAWELLIEAKQVFDAVVASGELEGEALLLAERQLAICEGSDWFWWFGDYNPGDSVKDFDRLYRHQLQALYQLLGRTAPESLQHVISEGGGSMEVGGVMRRGKE
jgi:alpha-amylase/alpha-mannosidase (GH57 family)